VLGRVKGGGLREAERRRFRETIISMRTNWNSKRHLQPESVVSDLRAAAFADLKLNHQWGFMGRGQVAAKMPLWEYPKVISSKVRTCDSNLAVIGRLVQWG